MTAIEESDALRKGTWLLNTAKHLRGFRSDAPEVSAYSTTDEAAKAGSLLALLANDTTERVGRRQVEAYAMVAGIPRMQVVPLLKNLRRLGKVDFDLDDTDAYSEVEVYSFSSKDALLTTAALYDQSDPAPEEDASLVSLERTLWLPRRHDEIVQDMTDAGITESTAMSALGLQETLGLLRTNSTGDCKLYYNEYAFAENSGTISKTLHGLRDSDRQTVEDIQHLVEQRPGLPRDDIDAQFPSKITEMMEGVGLLDAMTVHSPHGDATFLTLPQLRGIAIGLPAISADVFHKAKALLNCMRYGSYRSWPGRGQIVSDEMMVNIVRKLVRGETVGPCTAIGEDYRLLEFDGVISTHPADGRRFVMTLRQKEVGRVVLQMLEYNRATPEMDLGAHSSFGAYPNRYTIPEERRSSIRAASTAPVEAIVEQILQSIRTSGRQI
jgi:hypothetical protein